ncbi:hypothetical protein M5X11_21215 [Paenibacillus alginolyticus]|uniref:hypothetical protein n=1 Tax=Paenibacillus alginolyticus TaxID=59839 RepID=UPI0004928BC7|nr:hypothetical protein [Paenibacillus alginolyticus]MCY9667412.1 hypothetical protein [Paenibacillus alginolyticus]
MRTSVIRSAKLVSIVSLTATMLIACSDSTQTSTATETKTAASSAPSATTSQIVSATDASEAYKVITDEMNKKDSKPDYALVSKTYSEKLKSLVQKRDGENKETTDQLITSAIDGAKEGKMDVMVAKQVVDKLLQKVLYTSMKASFKEVNANWSKPEEAKKALAEAKAFYKPVLESTVQKRDNTFKTTMVDTINSAFIDMEKSIGGQSTLPFELSKQVADKTLMKTFTLVVAAKDQGYAYKVEKGAAEGKDMKVQQAEGWAFFQSITKYVEGQSKDDAALINKQLDVAADAKSVKGDVINGALVRGLAKVALHEYKQSQENWGQDKAAITGLEGALFIDMISLDITRLQGEATYTKLKELTDKYNLYVKDNKKEEAAETLKQIDTILNETIAKAPKAESSECDG